MVTDPISDMLIRIKNAGAAGKETAEASYSKAKLALALFFEKNGYLKKVEHRGKKSRKIIEMELIYNANNTPFISGVSRVSKPSRRIYKSAKDMAGFSRSKGIVIISTPKGILSAKEAKEAGVGGEVICRVW